jgi:hypothetical protein
MTWVDAALHRAEGMGFRIRAGENDVLVAEHSDGVKLYARSREELARTFGARLARQKQ